MDKKDFKFSSKECNADKVDYHYLVEGNSKRQLSEKYGNKMFPDVAVAAYAKTEDDVGVIMVSSIGIYEGLMVDDKELHLILRGLSEEVENGKEL